MTITPYRIGDMQFAFDDPATGLVREPFIGNANYHLDKFLYTSVLIDLEADMNGLIIRQFGVILLEL